MNNPRTGPSDQRNLTSSGPTLPDPYRFSCEARCAEPTVANCGSYDAFEGQRRSKVSTVVPSRPEGAIWRKQGRSGVCEETGTVPRQIVGD